MVAESSSGEEGQRPVTPPLSSAPAIIPDPRGDGRRLREIEDRYQALVTAAAQIVWTTRADGLVDDMPLWRAYTGQSVDEVKGHGWLDAVHPDDRERTVRVWAEAVATKSEYETEYRVRRRDGVYRSFLVRGVPVLEPDGRIREWVGFCTDITARLRSEADVRAIMETALDAIITMDHIGRVVAFNPAAERIFGYSRAEALGQDLADLIIPPDTRERHRAGLATYLTTGEGPLIGQRVEVMALRKDGSQFPAELAITRVPADGPPLFTGYLRDITERRQAEEALRESRESFRLLFASNPQPMWVYDLETLAFLAVNDAAVNRYGYTHDEFLRLRITDIRPAEDVERVMADTRQSRPTLQYSGVWRHRRKDGTIVDVEITSHMLPFGGRRAALVMAQDITERLRAEASLRESEERLRTVVTNAPIVLFAIDRQGIFTFSHGRGLESLGLRPEQHVGQSYFELYGHLTGSVTTLKRVLAGEAATTVDEYGDIVFETRWVPTRDADGTVAGVIGVSADITERRRLERRTHEALNALLAMAEALVQGGGDIPSDSQDALWGAEAVAQRLVALTRSVLGCRRVSLTMLDAETGRARPLAVTGATPGDEQAWRSGQPGTALRDYLDAAQLERLMSEDILVVDAADARDRPFPYGVRTMLLALMRVGRQVVGVLSLDHGGVAHSYTADEMALARAVAKLSGLVIERERLLREREEARASVEALREANRRMDEFLGIAGHEMRTPLTSMKGNIQVALRRLLRLREREEARASDVARELGETQRLLKRMDAQTSRLNRLVDDLLDVSRIREGRLEIRTGPCDLAAIVREVVEEHRQASTTRAIRLEMEEGAVPVQCDAERIGQVLTNYLSNALKYSPPATPVAVGLQREGATARVWVRDEGPGLAAAAQERVWERFYRVEGVEHQYGSSMGLGLGLHISRTIVERHGGQVGVESSPGAGATFWFTLPLAVESDP